MKKEKSVIGHVGYPSKGNEEIILKIGKKLSESRTRTEMMKKSEKEK